MNDDRDYYYSRAEAELEQAQRSDIPQAVQAHYVLAQAYLDKAYADADAEDDAAELT